MKKIKNINCKTPASVTPTERYLAIFKLWKYEIIILIIKTRFKIIGAAAAAANLFLEFRIPEKNEDKLTKNKKGKVILVNSTARLNFILSSTNPGAIKYTKYGVNISTSVTIKSKINKRRLKTSSAKFFPSFWLLI